MPGLKNSPAALFSPEGRLHQVEYAFDEVLASSMCLGIVASDGVLLAAECCDSRMIGWPSQKMLRLCENVACTWTGRQGDATNLTDEMRVAAQRYRYNFGSPIPCVDLVREACTLKQLCTQCEGRRPFGISVLYMGWDHYYGYQLYRSDPSGDYTGWKATATGQHYEQANALLELELDPQVAINLEQAKQLALKVLDRCLGSANLLPDKLEMSSLQRVKNKYEYNIFEISEMEQLIEKYRKGQTFSKAVSPVSAASPTEIRYSEE